MKKDKKACEGLINRALELMGDMAWQLMPVADRVEFVKVLKHLWEAYPKD